MMPEPNLPSAAARDPRGSGGISGKREAHIRGASRKEAPGFFRPQVCAIGGQVHSVFKPWAYEISIPSLGFVLGPTRRARDLVYALPDGRELSIASNLHGRWFNGADVHERWPTPQRRELVCGAWIFRVKPEDDTLLFDFTDPGPDLMTSIAGFHIYAYGTSDPGM